MHTHGPRVALAASLLVALAGTVQAQATGSGIPVTKDGMSLTRTPSTTLSANKPKPNATTVLSGGDVLPNYAEWNDANIIAHMIIGDSLEIEISRLAVQRAASAQVRDFANTLLTEHTAHLAVSREMMVDEDLGFSPRPDDAGVAHLRRVLAELQGLSGTAFDQAFARHQAMHHKMDQDALRAMLPQAKDDDLEEHIEETIVALGRHHQLAMTLASSLGVHVAH